MAGMTRRFGKIALGGLAILAGAAVLASCGERSGSEGERATGDSPSGGDGRSYTIGVIAKSQGNAVFQAARVGAEAAAAELSREHGVQVTINWRTPTQEDAQQQATYVDQLVSGGIDGIAISASDPNLLRSTINNAVRSGVTVVTFDSDVPDSDRMAYYGVDDAAAGARVMAELARILDGEGVVAVLAGNQNATNLQARVRGVREEAARHEGIRILDVYYHPETANDAVERMRQVQTANPQITGWALVGGWPLYTENALDGIHQNAAVVSMDPLPLPLRYLERGQVQVLVGQPYYGWGYEAVKMIFDEIHNDQRPENEIVIAEMDIVTRDNVDEFVGRWERWLQGQGGN
ncbi:MAG: sugar ABC transporter substrate-binding protein [Phycisphaerales bacterium]|nr:MAG: sugar ABC transporter substrate-binding protein [Phycisphaerales bacterium]